MGYRYKLWYEIRGGKIIMPNFTYYSEGTSTRYEYGWVSATYIQQMWEEHQQECARQDAIMEQLIRADEEQAEKDRQRQEDKKKYPLFFIKDGIV